MSTALIDKPTIDAALFERVLIHGDLKQLSPAQKVSYYKAVCDSVGLNPLTQPFQYIVLNGKEVLYATRAATEQLRQVHTVSVQIMAREVVEDCYVVTARASLPGGRQDENIGVVPIANLKGENRANAMMKAETKAKRRVTLAICGLGMLDETEVASIQPDYVVSAPAPSTTARHEQPAASGSTSPDGVSNRLSPNGGDSGVESVLIAGNEHEKDGFPMYVDAVRIERVERQKTKNANVTKYIVVLSDGRKPTTIKDQLASLAEQCCQNGEPVTVETEQTKWGDNLLTIHRVARPVIDLHIDAPGLEDGEEPPF